MLSTCPLTIRGWLTEILSSPIRVGFRYPESFTAAHQFILALDLESASSEDLGGAGITGIMIGTVTARIPTITPTSHTAAPSSIATTPITTAEISIMATRFTEAGPEAEMPEAFLLTGTRALG